MHCGEGKLPGYPLTLMPTTVDYLISPSPRYHRQHARVGSGAAILVINYLFILLILATYLRTWLAVTLSPGYLPRGASWEQYRQQQEEDGLKSHSQRRRRARSSRSEKADQSMVDVEEGVSAASSSSVAPPPPPLLPPPAMMPMDMTDLERFYTKDVYVCQDDGRPAYCSACCHFKTDRAHHCREVDRCVSKMDHFCPW